MEEATLARFKKMKDSEDYEKLPDTSVPIALLIFKIGSYCACSYGPSRACGT